MCERGQCETQRTLSSIVSNLVRTIPSMVRSVPSSEWSTSASLNLANWSTASLPTSASPTNKTRSGAFTRISWERWGGGGEWGRERRGEEQLALQHCIFSGDVTCHCLSVSSSLLVCQSV